MRDITILTFYLCISGNGNLELFDSESGPDLTLSPQTFTSTAEAFINDNSDSLGVPGDNDTGKLSLFNCKLIFKMKIS